MPFVDGLFSGLDTTSIINQLIALEQRPILQLQGRVEKTTQEKTALLEISAALLALQTRATSLGKVDNFSVTSTSSSNEGVLLASGSAVTTTGSFLFQPARLATTNQFLSSGFVDTNTTPVGSGTLELTIGGGFVAPDVALADLNGGAGVTAGSIRITDRSGSSTTVDLASAVTVEDVVDRINASGGIGVTASVVGDRFVLDDQTGGGGNLKVEEVGGTTAAELGLLGSVAGPTLNGADVVNLAPTTSLLALNDGNGVRRGSGNDFSVVSGAVSFSVDISAANSVQDVLDLINNDAANTGPDQVTASIAADGNRLEVVNGSAAAITIGALGGSQAAADLGLAGTGPGGTLTGGRVLNPLSSVLLSDLNGGAGIGLGTLAITDRSGASTTVNLAGLETLEEVVAAIDAAAGVSVDAAVNAEGNGLVIQDTTGSTASNLIVTDAVGTAAADLGIDTGAGGVAASKFVGSSSRLRFVSEQTRLSDLNLGKGVAAGKFEIVDSNGVRATIDLTQADDVQVEDVIQEINGSFASVTARINDNGDGILIEDTGGGAQLLQIRDILGGSTASDLGLAATATGTGPANRIDGTVTHQVAINATDTLEDVRDRINALGLPINAAILDTGSGTNPYRLSITSSVAGLEGRILVDPGDTSFTFTETVEASDSVLLFGGGTSPVRLTSNKNTFSGVVEGLTLDVVGTSTSPVTVNIQTDSDKITGLVQSFVDKFNEAIDKIDVLTDFDPETNRRALLFGDATLRGIRNRLFRVLTDPSTELGGQFSTLSQVGISILQDGTLTFDRTDFAAALADDPAAVQDLFTNAEFGFGHLFEETLEFITDPTDGSITRATSVRDRIIDDLKDRIEAMTERVDAKREILRLQFTRMEEAFMRSQSTLARLTQTFNSLGQSGGGGGGLFGI